MVIHLERKWKISSYQWVQKRIETNINTTSYQQVENINITSHLHKLKEIQVQILQHYDHSAPALLLRTATSTSTSIVATAGWGSWGSWRCCCTHTRRAWCVATVICSGASLVGVTRVVALGANDHGWASFRFIHVVPNPLFLPSSNTLAQFWIRIRYVHFSERTPHEVALNCLVPSAQNRFLLVVFKHVPIVTEISDFITCHDHMCAGPM